MQFLNSFEVGDYLLTQRPSASGVLLVGFTAVGCSVAIRQGSKKETEERLSIWLAGWQLACARNYRLFYRARREGAGEAGGGVARGGGKE